MEKALKMQVEVFEASVFTKTSANTFELTADYDGAVESARDKWVQCERCVVWRKLPQGSNVDEKASWECGQSPMEQTRCHKSRKQDHEYDPKADVVTKAHIHGVPVGSRESSADSERTVMKQHVEAFLSSNEDIINTAVTQQIREAVEKGMGKKFGSKKAKAAIGEIITECVKEEEERARLCLQRNDWFVQIISSSGKLGDVAFEPPTTAWSDYFKSFSQGQQLMPIVCRVLPRSVGITGVIELQESKTSAFTLECYTLEHNCSLGANMELRIPAQDTWLRRGNVNVTELSACMVSLLQSRLMLQSPLTRDTGRMFRMGTEDVEQYTARMQRSEDLRLERIQEEETKLEQLHCQKTPVEAAIERTFEEECRSRIPWAELAHDMQHPGGKGATAQVSKFTWSSQVENEGSKTVALKQFTNVTSLDKWTSEGSQALKREIYLARACSGLNHVISLLGITFVNNNIESPKSLGLVYEWKEQTLTQLLIAHGPVVGPDMERTMISILLQIAAALEALHQQTPAIIHRDLKPSNVLIEKVADNTEQFCAFLCDFGSAKAVSSNSDHTNTGNVGTKVFQAPELRDPKARITHKCDVYSFGVTAAQLALGVTVEELESRLKLPSLPLRCTDNIRHMISNCMQDSPQARPDFTEIKLELSDMLQRGNTNLPTGRADIEFIRHTNGKAIVFRVLNDTQYARDILHEGLTAGSPFDQTTSAVEHVRYDKKVPKSRYISPTMSAEWALYYFAKMKLEKHDTCLIVCIDLDKLPTTCKVHSLTNPETRTRLGFVGMAKNFATSAYEVLIEPAATQPVPLAAITTVYKVQDMLLTENVCLFDKLKEGLISHTCSDKCSPSCKKDAKYMGYNDWSTKIAALKRLGYRYTCTCTSTSYIHIYISCTHNHVHHMHAHTHTCYSTTVFFSQVQPDPREGARTLPRRAA